MKKILIYIGGLIIIAVIVVGIILTLNSKKTESVTTPPVVTTTSPISLCFYGATKTSNGLSDVSLVTMHINGNQVTGEFKYLPGEKDREVGTFSGTVGPVDKVAMARTADVWWDSMGEGMETKQQLKIIFGEGTAQAGFGEMTDRGDGVYVYKNPSTITYGQIMSDIDCNDSKLTK